ncbi:hypothetical protein ACFJIY_22810 [Pimelobacter simplex]|uniref:hypothetical protein n=1 Tax=Nocardioides simplex TaxID=2045 RepID=UPI0036720077
MVLAALAATPALALGATGSPTASAQTPGVLADVRVRELPAVQTILTGRPAQADSTTLSDSAQRDLRTLSENEGVRYDELAARTVGSDELDQALQRAEERPSLGVLESGVESAGGFWVEVGAGAELAEVAAIFAAVPARVAIHRRIDATVDEITDVQERVFLALSRAPVTSGVEVDYDAHRAQLEVDVAVPQAGIEVEAEAVAARMLRTIASASPGGLLPVPVEMTIRVGTDRGTLKGKRGGRALRLASDGTFVCTGGFTAMRNGVLGLITARHCPNGLTYNRNPILTFVTGASTTATGGVIDLQFHRFDAGTEVDPVFRASGRTASDDRTVRAVANAPVGSGVCAWGAAGGYDCARVDQVNVCRNGFGDGVDRCGLDRATSEITVAGDSGGPWFFGDTARGTLTGAINGHDYFTRIGRVANNLDAEVLRR